MLTSGEIINRRIGRMEALEFDLNQVKPGFQPTELEIIRAAALYAALEGFIQGATPEPAPEAKPEAKNVKTGKK